MTTASITTQSEPQQSMSLVMFNDKLQQMIEAINRHFDGLPTECLPTFEVKPIDGGYLFKIKMTIFSKWNLDFIDSLRPHYCKFLNQPWMSVDIPSGKVLVSMFASETYIKNA